MSDVDKNLHLYKLERQSILKIFIHSLEIIEKLPNISHDDLYARKSFDKRNLFHSSNIISNQHNIKNDFIDKKIWFSTNKDNNYKNLVYF
jgi:hypothetical protein